ATALVTGVGLLPVALGVGQAGKELQQPMAVVTLGGIVTSTFLNMIVIPPLYFKYASCGVRVEDEVYSAGAEGLPAGDKKRAAAAEAPQPSLMPAANENAISTTG